MSTYETFKNSSYDALMAQAGLLLSRKFGKDTLAVVTAARSADSQEAIVKYLKEERGITLDGHYKVVLNCIREGTAHARSARYKMMDALLLLTPEGGE